MEIAGIKINAIKPSERVDELEFKANLKGIALTMNDIRVAAGYKPL